MTPIQVTLEMLFDPSWEFLYAVGLAKKRKKKKERKSKRKRKRKQTNKKTKNKREAMGSDLNMSFAAMEEGQFSLKEMIFP